MNNPDIAALPGNGPEYFPHRSPASPESPLAGKKIIFLGSSVTYGSAALGNSFVEYLAAWEGAVPWKEAVSGTLLADTPVDGVGPSYLARLKTIDPAWPADCFLCQLSTNDAWRRIPLGEMGSFDTATVTGALETIIRTAQETWRCPVAFYTGTRFESPAYAAMVERLLELKDKWDIHIIDLWNDRELNAVSQADYSLYMNDPVHPTMAGYSRWWLPKIRKGLTEAMGLEG